MCELLGLNANVPTDICFSLAGLMQRGGKTGPHRDGWGIAFYEGRGCRTFLDPEPSSTSKIAGLLKDYPIKSKNVISHIRRGNRGKVSLENTHPFQRVLWKENWCFAHNGEYRGIKTQKLVRFLPVGTTDSEHAFCWLLDKMRSKYKSRPRALKGMFQHISKLCQRLAKKGISNLLFSDSIHLYAYCSTNLYWITRKAPFKKAHLVDEEISIDFKQVTTKKDVVTIIATQPLTKYEKWNKFSKDTFMIFKDGNVVYSSKK
jgi:glutamine amidotransferase